MTFSAFAQSIFRNFAFVATFSVDILENFHRSTRTFITYGMLTSGERNETKGDARRPLIVFLSIILCCFRNDTTYYFCVLTFSTFFPEDHDIHSRQVPSSVVFFRRTKRTVCLPFSDNKQFYQYNLSDVSINGFFFHLMEEIDRDNIVYLLWTTSSKNKSFPKRLPIQSDPNFPIAIQFQRSSG